MKPINALLCLVGLVNGAAIKPTSLKGLADGMYTIPYVNGAMDFSRATLDSFNLSAVSAEYESLITRASANPTTYLTTLSSHFSSGNYTAQCEPQFPTRYTKCRDRTINRIDYMRALAMYLFWIRAGPDNGIVPPHQCKSSLVNEVLVATCSTGGPNPACEGEVLEAMREVDTYCGDIDGGDIQINHWKKRYTRHNVRDGGDINFPDTGEGMVPRD
ncbi:hypothetical protein ABKA04_006665 [Annulohypoxylon sp. FPYF3050]